MYVKAFYTHANLSSTQLPKLQPRHLKIRYGLRDSDPESSDSEPESIQTMFAASKFRMRSRKTQITQHHEVTSQPDNGKPFVDETSRASMPVYRQARAEGVCSARQSRHGLARWEHWMIAF